MLKLTFITALLAATCAEDINWFTGRILPVVSYPAMTERPMCYWQEVSVNNDASCNCGERGKSDVLNLKNDNNNHTSTQAAIVIENADDIADVVALNCTCSGTAGATIRNSPVAIQKLNDNTYAFYLAEHGPAPSAGVAPVVVFVVVKTVPKLTELRDLISTQEHLKTRESGLLCKPEIFD